MKIVDLAGKDLPKGKIFYLLKEYAASIISNIENIYKNNPKLTDGQKITLSK